MASQEPTPSTALEYTQLTQIVVPLEQAAQAFAVRDATGRIPIVVVPARSTRVRGGYFVTGVVLLAAGIAAVVWGGDFGPNAIAFATLCVLAAIILIALSMYGAFRVLIPEGVNALLARGGRYDRTVGPGIHFLMPWIQVTHLVTRREIPFDTPSVEVPTSDNVRAIVDTLSLFQITDPFKFVYNISADDFDSVFLAANQEQVRRLVRGITVDQVHDLPRTDLTDLVHDLSESVARYGVTIVKVVVTFAQPPADFVRSQEARQLASLQQKEQAEQQALALKRQADQATLQQREVVARVEREREALEMQIQVAETRRRVVEVEADTEEYRLGKLQERLQKFPEASQWEWAGEQLSVARALAANSRAILQLGSADDILRTFMVREMVSEQRSEAANGAEPEAISDSEAPT
ncbi:MAG: SPFH domain-containing protein [Anaerolineae bacterium]